MQVLALLATRIFPTSLSSFYRFDKLVREVAAELLPWQLPGDEHADLRHQIVDRLAGVADATPAEEGALWALSQAVSSAAGPADPPGEPEAAAMIAASGFSAAQLVRRAHPVAAAGSARPDSDRTARPDARWETFD